MNNILSVTVDATLDQGMYAKNGVEFQLKTRINERYFRG